MRGGIKQDGDNWQYHCFNCNFKCGFKLGRNISKNCRRFLSWCGMHDTDINKWSLHSLQHKDLLDSILTKKKQHAVPKFKEQEMPEGELIYTANQNIKFTLIILQQEG